VKHPGITLAALLLLVAPIASRAGELVDARIGASACGGTAVSDVALRCGPTQFFDNYETRTDGFDPAPYVLFHPQLGANGALRGDAALSLRLDGLGSGGLVDDGSHLRVRWRPEGWEEREGLDFAIFPYATDRFRLGFSRAISWGGDGMFPRFNPDNPFATGPSLFSSAPIPGARAHVARGAFDGFLGVKATTLLDKSTNDFKPAGALLGGFGFEVVPGLRVDANGGYFDRGTNPKQEVLGQPVRTVGGSLQLSYASRADAPGAVNLTFAEDDPTLPGRFFQPDAFAGGLSWRVSTEATVLGTLLMDPAAPAKSTYDRAYAGDVQLELRKDALQIELTGSVRNVGFLLVDVPSFVPFVALNGATATTRDELDFWARATYRLPSLRMTPGAAIGLLRPATFGGKLPNGLPGATPTESATVVIRSAAAFDVLPPCSADPVTCPPGLIAGAKVFARFDIVEHLIALVELHADRDPNRFVLTRTGSENVFSRQPVPAVSFGGRLAVTAGF
jgi:hypothetical protein